MQAISIGWWRFAFTIVGGLCAGLATLSAANAQSLDPQQPAALAPGVNKGNVDSFKGAHYYYFWAGPGHFDVNMAFREMGLFGASHRQSLSFDFYDDDAKLISHNAISSAASLERVSITGDLDRRRRIRLAIVPQKGAIRLGGYYEIEVAGATELVGSPGASANVAPQSTALVNPGATLVEPETTLVQPGTTLVQPGTTLVQPGTTLVQPETTLVQPGTRLVQPGTTLVQPGTRLVQPGTTLVQPGTRLVQPGTTLVQPGTRLVKSGTPLLTMNETEKEIHVALSADVLFDFDKSNIRPDAAEALEQLATVIRERNHGIVRIEGHTDSKGSNSYNQRLSQARARAVEDWLVRKDGFRPVIFTAKGFAAQRPVAPNTKPDGSDDPEGRQRNRRVELVIAK